MAQESLIIMSLSLDELNEVLSELRLQGGSNDDPPLYLKGGEYERKEHQNGAD